MSFLMLAAACGPPRIPAARVAEAPPVPGTEGPVAPSFTAPDVRLTAVWGSGPTDVWVSGLEGTLLHFDGTAWEQVDLGTTSWIESLGGTGPDDVCAGVRDRKLFCRDGGSWRRVELPVDDYFQVSDIEAGNGGELFIASWTGPLLERRDGVWEVVERAPLDLGDIAAAGDGDLFAIGGLDGGVLRFHDDLWIAQGAPIEGDPHDVWAESGDDAYVVGGAADILHFDGEEWRRVTPPIATLQDRIGWVDLLGVWGSAPDDVFVVGMNGLVLHMNGDGWSLQESPTRETLEAVWGSSADDVYAVGWGGTILHYDGSRWTHAAASRSSGRTP
ncbi:MAG: hypothetical protein HY905_17035 [Deltaproteobacteria bacterium]|nr:hypothetical protein [Deltaproteobacteria bacterium]